MKIRAITENDVEKVLGIYEYYVKTTAITFEEIVPSIHEFTERVNSLTNDLPWLVYEYQGDVVGYAYAAPHRSRASYRWTKEISVYVHKDHHRKKIATGLYTSVVDILIAMGIKNALAGITLPNEKSEGFHYKFGFKEVGIYHNIGYKFDKWHDVMWLEKRIGDGPAGDLIPIGEIEKSEAYLAAIRKGESLLVKE